MFGASVRSAMVMLGALAVSATLYAWLPFEAEVRKSLSLTVFSGVLWLTEATFPHALVFGAGRATRSDMLRAGGALDLACIALLTRWAWSRLP